MKCIVCSADTKVVNSRPHKKTPSVWRRRQCTACTTAFTTNESVTDHAYPLTIVDGATKEEFSFPKLMVSLFQVFSHHRVSEAAEESYWLAQTITQDTQAGATDRMAKKDLTKLVYDTLLRYDDVAGALYGLRHHVIVSAANQKPRRSRRSRG